MGATLILFACNVRVEGKFSRRAKRATQNEQVALKLAQAATSSSARTGSEQTLPARISTQNVCLSADTIMTDQVLWAREILATFHGHMAELS